MPEVLITGAAGFTGRALVQRLAAAPDARIFGADRFRPADVSAFAEFFQTDLRDLAGVGEMVQKSKPDWIIHLAGLLKGGAAELFQANLQNTVNLLEVAAAHAPKASVLLIGSAAEYGFSPSMEGSPIAEDQVCDPRGPYGISKYAMTLAGLDFGRRTSLRVNVARTFNLIGPGSPPTLLLGALIERVRAALASGAGTITVGNVSSQRDFIDVRDAVDAYVKIITSGESGQVYNVCSGVPTRIQDLVEAALAYAPRPIDYRVDPALLRADDPKCVIGHPGRLQAIGFAPRISIQASLHEACSALKAA